ncbi:MAG: tRNA (guanine(46)-N(7))-methyltransferase TrmB [Actinomycetaceae bacterium]|nr:tRNA (guanine(46)-N(7))-methyltransferase TrmB [Actinomycetaceae bacterium]
MRGSRLGKKYEELVDRYACDYMLDVPRAESPTSLASDAGVNLAEAFGREAPLAIEIGPGSGEQCVSWALEHPDWNVLAIEAWAPGAARCLARIVREKAENVRILEADAAQALPVLFGLKSAGENSPEKIATYGAEIDAEHPGAANERAQEIWTFFPDPWRKKRHHKRRLVNPTFAGIVAGCLADGGVWRLATDWDNYAWQMRNVIEESPYFENPYVGERRDENDDEPERGGFAPRWEGRIMTRFEQRGIDAGRTVHDICGDVR